MISKERLTYLIDACNAQQATPVEMEELDHWYASFDKDTDLTGSMNAGEKLALEHKILEGINAKLDIPVYSLKWKYFAAAAAVLITLSAGIIFYTAHRSNEIAESAYARHLNDIAPGKNKAVLTLADGTEIDLNAKANGLLASQQNMKIVKTADGSLKYEGDATKSGVAASGMNTITIPRGGQYQVVLPDGSKVWLNAASSLSYPAVFTGNKREVELKGEAYFEITHDAKKPFSVRSAGQVVKVLGTHFNISSYPAEAPVKTTLLEGSIALSETGTARTHMLHPGQQATLSNAGLTLKDVDTEESIAWKNGLFLFRNTELKTLIYQLERWYDVDITYDQLPDKRFYGRISRDVKLSNVLNMLEVTSKIKFRIEGRRVRLEN